MSFFRNPSLRYRPSRLTFKLILIAFALGAAGLSGCSDAPLPPDPRPNILLISIDTLRADRLGAYGYERETSPFLDELAARGILYSEFHVNTHGTPPSHATLFTSQYQQTHGVSLDVVERTQSHKLGEHLRLLPEILQDAGYATVGVTAGGYMSSHFGFDRGFDAFHGRPLNVRRGAKRLLKEIRRRQGEGRPIFAFFHTYEVHSPYEPPRSYRDMFGSYDSDLEPSNKNLTRLRQKARQLSQADLDHLNALYDAGIRYTDDVLRDLFDELQEAGFFDHHLTVVTSDHGEEFGEHGGLLHPATLYEELVRTPLILIGSGIEPRVDDRLVSTVDVAPTLLERAGIPTPRYAAGRDLLAPDESPAGAPESVFFQYGDLLYGVKSGDYKLIENRKNGSLQLFYLARDPAERHNVAKKYPKVVRILKQRLDTWRQETTPRRRPKTEPETIDEEQAEQLRALGYVVD